MTSGPSREVADMEGAEALPRKNGELVFEELWEGRVFGMAVALNEQGAYPWRAFRDQLVKEIAAADSTGNEATYYERFLAAFEKLAIANGLVTPGELEARTAAFEAGEYDDDDHHEHSHDR